MKLDLTRKQIAALILAATGAIEDYTASGEAAPRALVNAQSALRKATSK